MTDNELAALQVEHPLWSHEDKHKECSMYPCLVNVLIAEVERLRKMVVQRRCVICRQTFPVERSTQFRRVTCGPDCFSEHMSHIKKGVTDD